jgi:hypothetical protein
MTKALRFLGLTFVWLVVALVTLWAVAALYIDCRIEELRIPLAAIYSLAIVFILVKIRPQARAAGLCIVSFGLVLTWWLSLRPSNQRNWRADVAQTAWAERDGDRITIHNLRNCDYRTETEFSDCWHDRTVDLSQLQAVDFAFVNWGVPWIGHPILSFAFADGQHIAFSIEARYQVGQSYSAVLGFFRQYELIFVAADERDVLRLRTNYRKDEEVYLYRLAVPPATVRGMFLTYLTYLNKLKEQPEWYNALTKNCTTTIDKPMAEQQSNPQPWTYQILVNGTLDELLYKRNRLVTGGLGFPELKEQAHINAAARMADQSPDFSAAIRRH